MAYLAIFVSLEVSKALSTEWMYSLSPNRQLPIPPSLLTLLPQIFGVIVSFYFMYSKENTRITTKYAKYFIAHSFLFFLNNALYICLLQYAPASSVQFLMHMKLPFTAVLHHFFIKRQPEFKPWLVLIGLFTGVLLTQMKENLTFGSWMVFSVCAFMSINSAMAAIYNEKLLKSLSISFWEQQAWISIMGVFWNFIYFIFDIMEGKSAGQVNGTFLMSASIVTFFTTFIGLFTGFLVKKFDSIVKLISNAFSSITIGLLVVVLFAYPLSNPTAFTVGSILVLGCTGIYAKLTSKKANPNQYPGQGYEKLKNIQDELNNHPEKLPTYTNQAGLNLEDSSIQSMFYFILFLQVGGSLVLIVLH